MKITTKENQILVSILSVSLDTYSKQKEEVGQYRLQHGLTKRSAAGVIGSLSKKGLVRVFTAGSGYEPMIKLTNAGLEALDIEAVPSNLNQPAELQSILNDILDYSGDEDGECPLDYTCETISRELEESGLVSIDNQDVNGKPYPMISLTAKGFELLKSALKENTYTNHLYSNPSIENTVAKDADNKTTLTKEMISVGAVIENKQNPEWGTWIVNGKENVKGIWSIRGDSGSRCLYEGEAHFWNLIKEGPQPEAPEMISPSPLAHITFEQVEGLTSQCTVHNLDTWAEVDAIIRRKATSAPDTGSYNKCDFVVYWEDGEEYTGRFDLQRKHSYGSSFLQKQIQEFIRYIGSSDKEFHAKWNLPEIEAWIAARSFEDTTEEPSDEEVEAFMNEAPDMEVMSDKDAADCAAWLDAETDKPELALDANNKTPFYAQNVANFLTAKDKQLLIKICQLETVKSKEFPNLTSSIKDLADLDLLDEFGKASEFGQEVFELIKQAEVKPINPAFKEASDLLVMASKRMLDQSKVPQLLCDAAAAILCEADFDGTAIIERAWSEFALTPADLIRIDEQLDQGKLKNY